MEWTEQFDPSLDFPRPARVSMRYAICSTPRSGSHLLGQLLFATGAMGCPLEYFNRSNLVRWKERAQTAGAQDLVTFLQAIRTSPNGCFAIKAHFTHLRVLGEHIPLDEFLGGFRHVHIVRRDLLAQAISYARAEQTGEWISRASPGGRTASYDSRLIRRCLVEVARQNASWEHLFYAGGLQPLVVDYESLGADPPRIVRDIAAFIHIDLSGVEIPGPRTSRQGDAETESWRERFVDDTRRALSWTTLNVLQQVRAPREPKAPKSWKRWLRASFQR